jgi:SAM-dependent methyltransferase
LALKERGFMENKKHIENIILDYIKHPIDLLNTGAQEKEYAYLHELKYTYIRLLDDLVPLLGKDKSVLEIGCLFGVVSVALKELGFKVTGCDLPEFQQSEPLRALYRKHQIPFDAVNLRDYKLPYPDESFDAVILSEVIEHLNFNPLPVFQEINRVLKKEGIIYIGMPNMACIENRVKAIIGRSVHEPIHYFFSQLDRSQNMIVSMHWREYTMKETIEMIDKMGFETVKKYYAKENGLVQNRLASLARKLIHLIPSLRTSLVVIGRKREQAPRHDFRFTEALCNPSK